MALHKGRVSSNTNEWATPQDFFDELNAEFNFTLDPCSTHENCKCSKHYTAEEDGLAQDWSDEIVFMNPPYGGNTSEWLKKAVYESKKGATVVCLIVSSTDRSYWHDIILPYAAQVRFVRGRLKFNDGDTMAPFASAVVVFTDTITFEHRYIYYDKSVADAKAQGVSMVGTLPACKDIDALGKEIQGAGDMSTTPPAAFYQELNDEFNFTRVLHIEKPENFLDDDWLGGTVFLSPNDVGNTGAWVLKAYLEAQKGATVVLLLSASTDRYYWHDIIFPYAAQVRFVRGRLKFDGASSTVPFSSAVIVFSDLKYPDFIVNYVRSASDAYKRGESQIGRVAAKYPSVRGL